MKDKVVVITGASSGIGEALAHRFAAGGSRLVLAARSVEKLEALARTLPVPTRIVACDVAQEADCERLMAAAVTEFGGIDVLIANAGISMRARFEHSELSAIRRVHEVNFWGVLACVKYALPSLVARGGSVVGVSSIAGYRGLPGRVGYSSSKFALNGFLEALRTEYLRSGLHVLTACPGFTTSNIRRQALAADGTPGGELGGESFRNEAQMMSAEAVADHIYRAVVRRRRTLILTRQGKLAVWLNKLLPALADRMVFKTMQKEANPVV